jgi:hypothetical protein
MHPSALPLDATTTTAGFLLVLSIVIPVTGVLLAFIAGDRHVRLVACAIIPFGLAIAVAILVVLPASDDPIVYLLGAWPPPLGIALRADALSAVMLAVTAVVITAVAAFAAADFSPVAAQTRATFAFWILLLAIWGALNTIFLGGDLFTLYVALELLTFAAVPLVSLEGRSETLQAALRYLLFALAGSVLYLLGAALLYGQYGTLDIVLLSQRIGTEPAVLVAAALMTTGLLAKTALFPLHLWLPPAHAGAPAAASAVLSGLVVKGSFFIIVRLWFNVMSGLPGFAATQLLAALGGAAIVFGSVVALRQERLKLLIAYSTLAQIGYLFLMFADGLSCHGESRDVHVGRVDLREAGSRPDHGVGRCRTGIAHQRARLRTEWCCADGLAAGRRIPREGDIAAGSSRERAVVVGCRASGGWSFHRRIRCSRAGTCIGACKRADYSGQPRTAYSRAGSAGARAMLAIARPFTVGNLSVDSARRRIGQARPWSTFESASPHPGGRGCGNLAGPLGVADRTSIALEGTHGDSRPGPSRGPGIECNRRGVRQRSAPVAGSVHLPPDAGNIVWSIDAPHLLKLRSGKSPGFPGATGNIHPCA